MGVVVDTSGLIAIERAGSSFELARLGPSDEPAVVPAIVYAELKVGVHLASDTVSAERRRARIDAFVERAPVVEFDRAIADRWAALFAELSRIGSMIPANDLQVAATALHLDFAVLLGAAGEAHFEKVPHLRIVRVPT